MVANIRIDTNPPRGATSGAAGLSQIIKRYKHSSTHICLNLISWEIIKVFFLTLFGGTAYNTSAAAVAPTGAITPEKVIRHNRKAEGGFWGQALPPPITGDSQFVENSG